MIECYAITTESSVAGIGLLRNTSGKLVVVVASPEVREELGGRTLEEVMAVCARKGWKGRKASIDVLPPGKGSA